MKNTSGKVRRSSKHNKTVSMEKKLKKRRLMALGLGSSLAVFAAVFTLSFLGSAGEGYSSGAYTACLLGGGTPTSCAFLVPEISAIKGSAALAVVAAVLLLVWERRRRFV